MVVGREESQALYLPLHSQVYVCCNTVQMFVPCKQSRPRLPLFLFFARTWQCPHTVFSFSHTHVCTYTRKETGDRIVISVRYTPPHTLHLFSPVYSL